MAIFVLGAGATRGSSFVDAKQYPCLPPLDTDFFTQLQRVQNKKHFTLINQVLADVVELFGPNFKVTLETMFTTLEHTISMTKFTGRDFKKSKLVEKRTRLMQAIITVLEDSLTEYAGGRSHLVYKPCLHHQALIDTILRKKDTIISFNYDCTIDLALNELPPKNWKE